MAKRGLSARRKGITFELEVMHKFIEAGYTECKTSRNESRLMDALKVDLCNIPFNVQCKNQERLTTSVHDELKGMPSDKIRAVFHKRNNKGTIVCITEEDFFKLIHNYGL